MTELQEGQKLERLIHVYGIEGSIAVSISQEGISFRVPGSRRAVFAPWSQVVQHCFTHENVPSFLYEKPFELLQHASEEVRKRKSKDGGK